MRRTVFLLIVLAVVSSCSSKPKFDETLFTILDSPSLVVKGTVLFDSGTGCQRQMYADPSSHIYRYGDDTMSEYFEISLEEAPSEENQTMEGSLKYRIRGKEHKENLVFEVVRIDSQNFIWLWSASSETVAVVALL